LASYTDVVVAWTMRDSLDSAPMTKQQRLWWAGILAAVGVLVLIVTCSCAGRQQPKNLPELYRPAVAKLHISNADGGGQCTAWKLTDELVATAGHCCDAGSTYTMSGENTLIANTAENVFDDDIHDICVLRGKLKGPAIELASDEPSVGAPVWTAGYPKGWFLISAGHWAGRDEDNEGICSVVVAGGASGSPVLNARGRAIGVLIKRAVGMDNLTIVAPIEWLTAAKVIAQRAPRPLQLTEPSRPPLTEDGTGTLLRELENLDKLIRELQRVLPGS
jgi:hypothetical protein